MAGMSLLAAAALAAATVLALRLTAQRRAHTAALAALSERVAALTTRLDLAEQDVAQAATQAQVAGMLLLDKGIADEEDVEAVRRRVDEAGVHDREGELH